MLLESVERENVVPPDPNSNPANAATPKDTFTIDPLVSARVPGAVDTMAFRFKFIAYSDTLRGFLDALAKFEYPLVVRSVEVEPATEDALKAAKAASAAAPVDASSGIVLPGAADASATATPDQSAAPAGPVKAAVVKNNLSEFTVVIEYINLIPPKPTGAPSA
jgi:hypothetical protein